MKKRNLTLRVLRAGLLASALLGTSQVQAQFAVTSSTANSEVRIGTASSLYNTGLLKWSYPTGMSSKELGIYTWADANPIRIGGNIVKFQHEGGNSNIVSIPGRIGMGTETPANKIELIDDYFVNPLAWFRGNHQYLPSILNLSETSTLTSPNYSSYYYSNPLIDRYGLRVDRSLYDRTCGIAVSTKYIGIYTYAQPFNESSNSTGLIAQAGSHSWTGDNGTSGINTGIISTADNAITAKGGDFLGFGLKYAYGIYASGGMMGSVPLPSGAGIYGVYGDVNGVSSLSGTRNIWAGYFNGDVYTTGSYLPSDRKLKSNVAPIEGALDRVMRLKPSTYNYNLTEYSGMNLPAGERSGFIAQELEEVFPGLVKATIQPEKKDRKGDVVAEAVEFTAVNYIELIPILTKAIQEQQAQIEDLKKQMAINAENKTKMDVNGTSSQRVAITQTAVLFQNYPNPLNGVTLIDYFIPATAGNAFLKVIDANGKLVQAFPIAQNGYGQIELDCSKLAPGTYTYSLLVNSTVIDSKTMLIARN